MAENTLQFRWIVTIKEGLDALFRDDANVFVAGDLFWYPVEGNNKIRLAPDALVVLGRPRGERRSYLQWQEGNIPPQVVFEVLSPGNRPAEMQGKFVFYEKYGVQEYYIYDPETGLLEGYRREGDVLRKISEMAGYTSPLLGIRFEPGAGPDNLRIIRPDGERFKTFQEVDEERIELARERNEVMRQRDEAADRAARYAAKLRELGIEPD